MTNLGIEKTSDNLERKPTQIDFPDETLFFTTTYGAPYGKNIDKKTTLLNHMVGIMNLFIESDSCSDEYSCSVHDIKKMIEDEDYAGARYKHKLTLKTTLQLTKDINEDECDLDMVIVWIEEMINKMDRFGNTVEIGVFK